MAARSKKRQQSGEREELGEYERKRDFKATPEPAPRRRRGKGGAPRFVVQEHSARRLHWDLRLEHDGVAASWAVPNGIPEDPSENRKAVHTEDHPLEYLEFEGEIPKGEYGAGTMKVWDSGTYELEKWEPRKVMVRFEGERLRGRYALFRAGKVKAAAKGQLHMVRGSGEQEKMLKNAKTAYWNEHEEIATYLAIESLAEKVGDTETAKLARGIRREEERMAKFLAGQIKTLSGAVASEEVPAAQRRPPKAKARRARKPASRSRS